MPPGTRSCSVEGSFEGRHALRSCATPRAAEEMGNYAIPAGVALPAWARSDSNFSTPRGRDAAISCSPHDMTGFI